MNKIIIKDESSSQALSYIMIYFFIVVGIVCAGLVKKGFHTGYIIAFIIASIASLISVLYYKNHTSFLQIDESSISCHGNKRLSKQVNEIWCYQFDEILQVIIKADQTSFGSRGNRTDIIQITIVESPRKHLEKRIVARLDTSTQKHIQLLAEKHNKIKII